MKRSNSDEPAGVQPVGASFRDPEGFVFRNEKGVLMRQVNKAGAANFDLLMSSGLYDDLVKDGLLIPHKTVIQKELKRDDDAHAIIAPQTVPFISYPFEWSFSQLKDAALLTLAIQKKALAHGLTLKDASAYNVQFVNGVPVFIDTLSFEAYKPGSPWVAYRQFCQHFLAPLALMAYKDLRLSQLSRVHLDGVPLDLAAKLLPKRTRARMGLLVHVVLHARAQKSKAEHRARPTRAVTENGLKAILMSLERTVQKLKPLKESTEWGDYYNNTNYTAPAADQKAKVLTRFVRPLKAHTAIDLGGNNGSYSRVLNDFGILTVCTDIDPNAVEANYRHVRRQKEKSMLPMLVDLTNPGGPMGWQNQERTSVQERLQADVVMALAIIHHLAISNNLPLGHIAQYFSGFAPHLVIEFVPKQDSQVKKLLSTREDIFVSYDEEGFEQAFGQYFKVEKKEKIKGTKRTLYLLKRK